MASEHVKEFTDTNWNDEVMASAEPVLIDFWAPWCGPCKVIAADIEALAMTYQGRVKIGKMNVSEHMNVPAQFQVRSIPTIILVKNGKVVDQHVGLLDKEKLSAMVEKAL